jgi:hypothetical protein
MSSTGVSLNISSWTMRPQLKDGSYRDTSSPRTHHPNETLSKNKHSVTHRLGHIKIAPPALNQSKWKWFLVRLSQSGNDLTSE